VQPGDGEPQVRRLLERVLGYRVFADAEGRMNRSLADGGGGLLLVSQFTLAADTRSGMRPGFSTAAVPAEAERWFNRLVELARECHPRVEIGHFGAHMKVHLVNDGPVTFWLEARWEAGRGGHGHAPGRRQQRARDAHFLTGAEPSRTRWAQERRVCKLLFRTMRAMIAARPHLRLWIRALGCP
jgi:D-tyrosyl-tRNA(Tyr) deacylase